MAAIEIGLGLALLFLGRQFYWLFVAAVGFVLGWEVGLQFFYGQTLTVLIVAIVFGLAAMLIFAILHRIAIITAGFMAGAYILTNIFLPAGSTAWPWLLIGGIAGAAATVLFFDAALVVLSSFLGAMLIVRPVEGQAIKTLLLFALFFTGILAQSQLMQHKTADGSA